MDPVRLIAKCDDRNTRIIRDGNVAGSTRYCTAAGAAGATDGITAITAIASQAILPAIVPVAALAALGCIAASTAITANSITANGDGMHPMSLQTVSFDRNPGIVKYRNITSRFY